MTMRSSSGFVESSRDYLVLSSAIVDISRTICPYLLALVDHPLHNTLHSFECRAHLSACSDWRNSIVERGFLVWVCKEAVFDCFSTFSLSVSLQLDVRGTLGICRHNAVSKRKEWARRTVSKRAVACVIKSTFDAGAIGALAFDVVNVFGVRVDRPRLALDAPRTEVPRPDSVS